MENTLAGDGREENIRLTFRNMKDFTPEQVARQIPQLTAKLAMRNLLRDLKANLLDNQTFRKALEKILLDPALRAELCQADGFTPNNAMLDKMGDICLAGTPEYQGQRTGLVLDVGGYYNKVITFAPSLEISRSEIHQAIVLLDQLIVRAKREL